MSKGVIDENLSPMNGTGESGTSSHNRRVGVLVPAAGMGVRLGKGSPKAFVELSGRTLLQRCIDGLRLSGVVEQCVIAVPASLVEQTRALFSHSSGEMTIHIVPGGHERSDSVHAALELMTDVDVILVHDAARCLTPPELIRDVVSAVDGGAGAVVPGLPVTDTIKTVNGEGVVTATVERSSLRAIQTPQGFRADLLHRAHQEAEKSSLDVTDDARLVELLGIPVRVIEGRSLAFKITTPMDMVLAEALVNAGALPNNRSENAE